jgi:hypothetical protein
MGSEGFVRDVWMMCVGVGVGAIVVVVCSLVNAVDRVELILTLGGAVLSPITSAVSAVVAMLAEMMGWRSRQRNSMAL